MSEDKADIERRIGISSRGKSTKETGMGRRAFLKAALYGAGATAIGLGISRALGGAGRPESETPKDGFYAEFQGTIHVLNRAVIYDRPTTWVRSEPSGVITTNTREETSIATVHQGEEFTVDNPRIFFRPAGKFSTHTSTIGQSGQGGEVDLGASYVEIQAREGMPQSVVGSIQRSINGVGFVGLGTPGTLGFQPIGQEDYRFRFTPEAIVGQ